MAQLCVTFHIHIPRYVKILTRLAQVWVWLGLPFDVDRYAEWAARRARITAE